jgi:hypothetical protein
MSRMVGAGAQVPRGGPRAALGSEAGAGAMGARSGPGAVPSREAGAGSVGHVAAPELPQPGGGSHCLDLMLVRGGTRSSGYPHLCHFYYHFVIYRLGLV